MPQLPIEIPLSSEMLRLISEIDEFKGRFSVLDNIPREQLDRLRKIATIESVGSSTRIEGVKLSDMEVENLLGRLELHSFATRDEEEVAGYAETMNLIYDAWQDLRLTENHIRQLHSKLLQYASKDQRHRGDYKKFTNHVEAFDVSGKSLGIVFATESPFETPRVMQELVQWSREHLEDQMMHPLIVIGIFIVHFLAIHPFQDGNGRLSRILTTLLLLRAGYAYVPYSSMETVIEANKDRYYLALRRTQGTLKSDTPVYDHWLNFFLSCVQKQKRNLEAKLPSHRHQDLVLPALSEQIYRLASQKGRVTLADIEHETHMPKSTIRFHLKQLQVAKHLLRYGKGRATWYVLS